MFKLALTKPKEISKAAEMSGWQTFGYLLLLSLIVVLPLALLSFQASNDIQSQAREIGAKIPDFQIENNRMTLAEETDSFIYQTEEYLFFFDPNGKMSRETVQKNVDNLNYLIGGGFLEDEIYIFSPLDDVSIPYSQLDGVTKENFASLFDSNFARMGMATLVVTLFFSVFISILFTNLLTAFIAFLFNRVFRKQLLFSQTWKIVNVASTWPFLIFSVLSLFGVFFLFQTLLSRFITLGLYFYGIKDTETPLSLK